MGILDKIPWNFQKDKVSESIELTGEDAPCSRFCRDCEEEFICLTGMPGRQDKLLACPAFVRRIKNEWDFDEKIKRVMRGQAKIVEVEEDGEN